MGIVKSYIEGEHTTLNTLKYRDSTTIGREPIVQKDIPTSIRENGPSSNQITKRVDDLKRIGTLLTRPQGLKYIANETVLSQINTGTTQTGIKGKIQQLGKGLVNTATVIGSTLAQVPLNGTGTHFVKGFKPKKNYHVNILSGVKKESRIKLGDPGMNGNKSPYYNGPLQVDTVDKINLKGPIVGSDAIATEKQDSTEPLKDLVKFRFTVVTPEEEVLLPFRAYLDTFSDSYTSDWSAFKYLGRAEDFYTYNGFGRSISLGFKIAAQTRYEMRPLYQKMVYLASSTAPTYSGNNLMRGTFVKLTLGSYVYEMPGFIQNMTYSWDNSFPWEIALNKENPSADGQDPDFDQQELPMALNCQMTFIPIHRFVPETGLKHYFTQNVVEAGKEDKLFFDRSGNPIKPNQGQAFGIPSSANDIELTGPAGQLT